MADNLPHSILPFVPAKDFELSTRYYRALGFEVNDDDDDVRLCTLGGHGFLLQDFYVKAWAHNSMLAMHVDDAREWIDRADALVDEFPNTRTTAPKFEDWGQIVGHIWDPSGVLWHITQTPPQS